MKTCSKNTFEIYTLLLKNMVANHDFSITYIRKRMLSLHPKAMRSMSQRNSSLGFSILFICNHNLSVSLRQRTKEKTAKLSYWKKMSKRGSYFHNEHEWTIR